MKCNNCLPTIFINEIRLQVWSNLKTKEKSRRKKKNYYKATVIKIDLVILVCTNKQLLVGAYLDPRQSSTNSKYAESGNYEALVVVYFYQIQ